MTALVRTIAAIRRGRQSSNGNPAFVLEFTDGTAARTVTDTGWAYEVDDSMVGQAYRLEMDGNGRIRFGDPA